MKALWETFCYLLFITIIGFLFVSFSVMLGKYELISLVFVILLGALLRPVSSVRLKGQLGKLPVVGEANDVFNELEKYYQLYPKKIFWYYLCYPISGIFTFCLAPRHACRELNAYFALMQWIILVLLIEGFASYFRFYQHFQWGFALDWFYLELLIVYFLCHFFAVPVATTALDLSLAGKNKRLLCLTLFSLVILGSFTVFFMKVARYDSLIPINIVLDQRMAGKDKENSDFNKQLKELTTMFLNHNAPKILEFNRRYYVTPSTKEHQQFFRKLQEHYQRYLSSIAIVGENTRFTFTTTQEYQKLWGIVFLPFRDSLLYIFSYQDGKLELYESWQQLSPEQQKKLTHLWDQDAFELSVNKQLARVAVDYVREALRQRTQKKSSREAASAPLEKTEAEEKLSLEDSFQTSKEASFSSQQIFAPNWQRLNKEWQEFLSFLTNSLPGQINFQTNLWQAFLDYWPSTWQVEGAENFYANVVAMKELAQEIQERRNSLPNNSPLFAQWNQKIMEFRSQLQKLKNKLKITLPDLHQQRQLLLAYDTQMLSFDYEKALQAQLLHDHHGKSPQLRKKWWSQFYSYFLSLLLWVFQLSMPFHVALIIYSRLQLGEI